MTTKARFFTKRIELDSLFGRGSQNSNHWVGASFKAFSVIDTNDSNFQLKLVPDPTSKSIQGIPLQLGGWHNFKVQPNNAVFENEVAQPGKWVEVLISTEDELTSGKIEALVTSRSIGWEGSTSPQSKVTVTSDVAELLDADDDRIIARFQYKSGSGVVYIGSEDELNDDDFANICHEVQPGDDFEIPGTGAHYAKSVGGDVIFSLRKGKD